MTATGKKTILLVDDEALIAMSESRMLEKHGYTVLTAYSGEQAIEAASRNPGLDLILMDIDLGRGMDGTQAAEVILKSMDIPVLFLSSHTEPEVVDKTEKITSYGYVVKNSGETVLLASIRMAFRLHAAHRELRIREEALGRSENKLSIIFENTPNAITITELQTGKVIEANRGIEWTGWTKDEVMGKSPAMLQTWVNPREGEIIREIMKSKGRVTNHRVDFHKKDGSIAHAIMNSLPIVLDGNHCLLTISNDVTRLIESESELLSTREELEGTNEELNATVEELEATNKELYESNEQLNAAIEELEATNEELRITNEELGISKNDLEALVAKYRAAEEDLRKSEQRYRTIFEKSATANIITATDTTIVLANSNFEKLTGYSREEIEGRMSWTVFVLPEYLEMMKKYNIQRRTDPDAPPQSYEFKGKIRSGEIRNFYMSVGMIPGTTESLASITDITDRVMAEEALRRSEERFSDLVRHLPETVYEADRHGRITFVNQTALERFGYTQDDIDSGMNVLKIIAPRDHEKAIGNIGKVIKGERLGLNEYTAVKKDGTEFPVLVHSSVIMRDGQTEGLRGFLVDITELKQAEESLRKNQELMNTVYENVGAYIFMKDASYCYTYANKKVCELFGRNIADIIGKPDDAFFSADSVREIMKSDTRVIEHGETITREETDLSAPDGTRPSTYWTVKIPLRDSSGAIYGLCGISTDITKLKQTEEALRESEDRWHFALEGAGDGLWDWNAVTNRVYFSHQWKAMLGYDDDEIGDTLDEWDSRLHPDDRDRVYAEINSHFEGKTPIYISEHRVRCKNGKYKWILDRGKVISWTSERKPLRVIGTHTDISELKRNEEALGKAIAEKEALLSELQHRMKNSLALITGIINLEIDRIRDKSLSGTLENIKGRIVSLSSLYALLFQSDTLREVDLGDYMRSIVNLLGESYTAGASGVRIEQRYDSLRVNAKNAAAWGLIANELLTNSFKYAFPGGNAGSIRIDLKKLEREIMLTVSDNGTGLPADFDIGKPRGLGLLLAKTLANQLRGSLSFERGKKENVFSVRAPLNSGDDK